MHGVNPVDPGREIDWGRTSADYARHRPGYPPSFYERLAAIGIELEGLRILDLGTGTGNLARGLARRGARVTGVDVSAEQVATALRLAADEGLELEAAVAPAEATGQPASAFDLVTASQCWLYFDAPRAIAEARRVLVDGGRLVTCHLSWLPREDAVARASEELVLRHNPAWSASDWSGEVPAFPDWARGELELAASFVYDEALPFTHEGWRGRIRACRGIGAGLSPEAVAAFDAEHAGLLEEIAPEMLEIRHRIDAHLFVWPD